MDKKTLFFDIGNVLLYFSHDKMCRQIAALCGLEEAHVRRVIFAEGMGLKYEKGKIDSRGLYEHFHKLSAKRVDFKHFMHAASDIFDTHMEIIPLIKELKQLGHRLITLSNICEAHFNHIYTHFPLIHLFDSYILSYEVGAVKPEKAIFEKALSEVKGPKENCFFTDDILDHIVAANQAGLPSEQFTTVEALRQHLKERHFLN
jgi:glucose-1-phosphatase